MVENTDTFDENQHRLAEDQSHQPGGFPALNMAALKQAQALDVSLDNTSKQPIVLRVLHRSLNVLYYNITTLSTCYFASTIHPACNRLQYSRHSCILTADFIKTSAYGMPQEALSRRNLGMYSPSLYHGFPVLNIAPVKDIKTQNDPYTDTDVSMGDETGNPGAADCNEVEGDESSGTDELVLGSDGE